MPSKSSTVQGAQTEAAKEGLREYCLCRLTDFDAWLPAVVEGSRTRFVSLGVFVMPGWKCLRCGLFQLKCRVSRWANYVVTFSWEGAAAGGGVGKEGGQRPWWACPDLLPGQCSLIGLVLPGVGWQYGNIEGAEDLQGVWMSGYLWSWGPQRDLGVFSPKVLQGGMFLGEFTHV